MFQLNGGGDAEEILKLVKMAMAGDASGLSKATFNQPGSATVGLQPYNLEPAAKNFVPYLSPLRNSIPRVGQVGGLQANWKGIVATSAGNFPMGISEGKRGGSLSVTTAEYLAAFRTIGLESSVTWEAYLSAQGFDDLKARAVTTLLSQTMVEEEKIILAGNSTYSIGAPSAAPTLTASTTGGAIGTGVVVSVICIPLTYEGKKIANAVTGPAATYTRTNADGQTDVLNGGMGLKSAAANVTTGGSGAASVAAKLVAPVRGAYGYAWYWGTVGSETFGALTDRANYTITTASGGGTAASAFTTDTSRNTAIHDGLLAFIGNSANGSYWNPMANGAQLTADGNGGCAEIDAALQWFWDNQRLSPSRIIYGSSEAAALKRIVLSGPATAGGQTSNGRFTFGSTQGNLTGGGIVRGYLNPFGMGTDNGAEVKLQQHPFMPAGTLLFLTDSLPYSMNDVTNIMQVVTRMDYHQLEWPMTSRQYQYGVYSDQVLQHYFMPSMGVITNIAAG